MKEGEGISQTTYIHDAQTETTVRQIEKGVGLGGGGQKGETETERHFVWGEGCTIQCADGVVLSCTLETCTVL